MSENSMISTWATSETRGRTRSLMNPSEVERERRLAHPEAVDRHRQHLHTNEIGTMTHRSNSATFTCRRPPREVEDHQRRLDEDAPGNSRSRVSSEWVTDASRSEDVSAVRERPARWRAVSPARSSSSDAGDFYFAVADALH